MRNVQALLKLAAVVVVTLLAATPPAVTRWLLRRPRTAARFGVRCAGWWGRRLSGIIGVRRRVVGRPEGEVFAVTSNHLTYLDIIILSSLYPSVFVAKSEIASWPIFGWITRGSGTLFVDRERARDVIRAGREMKRNLQQGISLTLFPEGQTTRGDRVLPFLPSLLEPMASLGIPCFGAAIQYETPGSDMPVSQSVCWWNSDNLLTHFWRLLQLPRVEAHIRFSERPVVSSDRKQLARMLHTEVQARFTPVDQAGPATDEASYAAGVLRPESREP